MDLEQEARTLGWVPQEEFKGNPERWVDAETFVERGKTVMPILKANNRRLEQEVERLHSETQKLQNLFAASQEAIGELQKVHSEATKAAVEKAKQNLLASLKQAKEEGDVELEVRLTDELTDLKAAQKEAAKTPVQPAPVQQQQPALHPDFAAWQEENKWFGTDERKTMRAMGIAQELRADPENDGLVGRKFFERIVEVMEERTNGPRMSKVGGTRPTGTNNGGSTDRSFNSLPPDAREACDRQGKKLVGEGRAFKDMAAWRTYYTKLYYQGEA